ncbi:MAG: histidine phosphatase family protein [Anaerolineae bacterium]
MELLLMRHAKSDWGQGGSDFDRPLNERGEESAEKMGRLLRTEGVLPTKILCSTAARARGTAEGLIDEAEYEGEVFYSDQLYLCDISDFMMVIKKYGDEHERLMVIAHNPGTEALIYHLTGEDKRVTTANIAQIELPSVTAWKDVDITTKGTLKAFWRPRDPQF